MATTELLNEIMVAQLLGVSVQKLQRDRWAGRSIPYVKLGRAVRYRVEDVEAYLAANTRTSTSQQAAQL